MDRRSFLRSSIFGSASLTLTPGLRKLEAGNGRRLASRVVRVMDDHASSGRNILQEAVDVMVESGIRALTGNQSSAQGWHDLLPNLNLYQDTVCIKVNAFNKDLPTHPEVVKGVIRGLKSIGLPDRQILVWDRGDNDLMRSGYVVIEGGDSVQVYGTGRSRGVFYDPQPFTVYDDTCYLSRIITETAKYIINISCLKASGEQGAGVTLCLKNHYGSFSLHPDSYSGPVSGKFHDNHCSPYIPALNALPVIRNKQVLSICDAIFGNANNNYDPPEFVYNSLLMSTDPVAVDALGMQILGDNGCTFTESAIHIQVAADGPYYLGTADVNSLNLIDVKNPYSSGHDPGDGTPEQFTLYQNYPNPFNPGTSIPFSLDREADVVIELFSIQGDLVRRLANRRMGALHHTVPWDGRDQQGRVLPSGHYICRMRAGEDVRTIRLVKMK